MFFVGAETVITVKPERHLQREDQSHWRKYLTVVHFNRICVVDRDGPRWESKPTVVMNDARRTGAL